MKCKVRSLLVNNDKDNDMLMSGVVQFEALESLTWVGLMNARVAGDPSERSSHLPSNA
jgi:hypothetical protein